MLYSCHHKQWYVQTDWLHRIHHLYHFLLLFLYSESILPLHSQLAFFNFLVFLWSHLEHLFCASKGLFKMPQYTPASSNFLHLFICYTFSPQRTMTKKCCKVSYTWSFYQTSYGVNPTRAWRHIAATNKPVKISSEKKADKHLIILTTTWSTNVQKTEIVTYGGSAFLLVFSAR